MASKQVEARKRARAAKAKVDARRAERDSEISTVQTRFFVASVEREQARAAMDAAEQGMASAVNELGDLEVRVEDIAELCEITAAEVRAFRKQRPTSASTMEGTAQHSEGGEGT